MALTAGLLLAGTAWPAQAAPATGAGPAKPGCGALKGPAAPMANRAAEPVSAAPVGAAGQKVAFKAPAQLPIGLWSPAGVTLRTPVSQGTVRLDVSSRGFSTDSVTIQRYVPQSHRWIDLNTSPGNTRWPHHGVFTFPLTATASPARPHTVALRLQDLDRPGRLTVTASVKDGHGHTYRDRPHTATATRPEATVSGWRSGTALVRGGPAHAFTLTVKNTTNRPYPALGAAYFAYGEGKQHTLTPKDLVLQQYRPGRGWTTVPLIAGGCDPGMGAMLRPTAKPPLAPGATAVFRLRLSVAGTAPRDVTHAESGLSVVNDDQSFFSRQLPFAIRGK